MCELERALRRVIANSRFTGRHHAGAHQGSAARPAVAAGEAHHRRGHPEDRGGLLQGALGGPAVQAPQPLDGAPAAGCHGARQGAHQPQSAGDRRCLRRARSHHPDAGWRVAQKSFGAKATAVPRGTWGTMLAARRCSQPCEPKAHKPSQLSHRRCIKHSELETRSVAPACGGILDRDPRREHAAGYL